MRCWVLQKWYERASPDKQRAIRKNALTPRLDAEMPEPYRIWRMCQSNGPWWSGGTADQPHLLLMESAICSNAYAMTQDEIANLETIIRGDTN